VTFRLYPAVMRCGAIGAEVDGAADSAYPTVQVRPGRAAQFINAPFDLQILTARILRQQSILKWKNPCI
jgi:hypothetical protein